MTYCTNTIDTGIIFDERIGKYVKKCKAKHDEKIKSSCVIS